MPQAAKSTGAVSTAGAVDADGGDTDDLRYAWRALSVVVMASILTSLNQNTLNIALPEVVRHFDATSAEASWILIVFALVTTCVTLACGRLADVMGRRSMYLLGLGIFTGVSLLAGLSPNVQVLIGLRIVQAIAAAMLLTNSAAIVSAAFPPHMLGRGLGLYMTSFSIAQLLGPTVGGALATTLGWRWVFWFNVPFGVVCLIWGWKILRKVPSSRKFTGLDLRGNVLLILGLGGFVVALSSVSNAGWESALVRVGFLLAVVFIPLFVWWEKRATNPLLNISLFKRRPFTMAILAGLINSIARSSVVIIAALYFQAAKGETALHAGLMLLPMSAANAVAAASVGFVTKHMLPRTVSTIGSAITTAGMVVMAITTGAEAGFLPVCCGLVLVGLGSGIFQPSNITSILEGTPNDQVGSTNAVRITVQNTANTIGIAMALTLLTAPLSDVLRHAVFAGTASQLGSAAVDELVAGYRIAFSVMAAVSLLAVFTSLASRSAYRNAQEADDKAEAEAVPA
ncbi:MAG: transporter [Pseudonocardiales bacterium]|nr:Drug resistance transporter, EmrB/QacA subfamily [Jatrophihabitantaceae bacterium]MCW2602804.1 transporter [Pseudonocardiales bacterium]